jgi:hypothetical protein
VTRPRGLVKRIASVEDDSLVAALKEEWSVAKTSREQAERRLAELEGIERDLHADQAEVEALLETWRSWQVTLLATINGVVPSSIPAETQAQARQILKKVLVGRLYVLPRVNGTWSFSGSARFEGVLSGGLARGEVVVTERLNASLNPSSTRHRRPAAGVRGGRRRGVPAADSWWQRRARAQSTGV